MDGGEVERAVRCAFWLASGLLHDGEHARANGRLARAHRLLEEGGRACVEHGYLLLLPAALQRVMQGDAEGAYRAFSEAAAIAERFGDADLAALACHGRGRVLIRLGQIREGVALLDEAMVAVETGEVSPLVAGDVYCSVIEGCVEISEVLRDRLADAGLEEIRVEQVTWRTAFESGRQWMDVIANSNPIGTMLVADLAEEQRAEVQRRLGALLRERSGQNGTALPDAAVNIGIGTK